MCSMLESTRESGIDSPSNSEANDTAPVESPDSYKLIGLMRRRAILPVPVWVMSVKLGGTLEPVRRN